MIDCPLSISPLVHGMRAEWGSIWRVNNKRVIISKESKFDVEYENIC